MCMCLSQTPNLSLPPAFLTPLVIISLSSMSVNLFLLCTKIHLYQFLKSTYKQYHADKEDVVCLYNGILLSHKNSEVKPTVATWMDLEITI